MKVAIYCRVSTNEQSNSIETQKTYLIDYCNKHNLKYELFIDEGISGTNIANRPSFLQLMHKVQLRYLVEYDVLVVDKSLHKEFDTILVKNSSRLGRDLYLLQILQLLKKVNVEVIFLEDNKSTDNDDPTSNLMLSIQAVIDRNFSEANSKKVKTGMIEGAKKGHLNITKLYGYNRLPNGTLEINESEAEIVRCIFNKYINGEGFVKIANYINENYDTKYFSPHAVDVILSNEKYYGCLIRNRLKKSKLNKDRTPIVRDEDEWIVLEHGQLLPDGSTFSAIPPIITSETYMKAQQVRKSKQVNRKYVGVGMLAGKIKCSKCMRNYVRNSYKDAHGLTKVYYVCLTKKQKGKKACNSMSISEDKLQTIFTSDYINSLVLRKKLLIKHTIDSKLNALKTVDTDEIVKLDMRLSDIKKVKRKLLDLLLTDTIDSNAYQCKLQELNKEEGEVTDKLSILKNDNDITTQLIEELEIKKTKVLAQRTDTNYKYEDILKMISSIIVTGKELEVHFTINDIHYSDTIRLG